MTRALFSPVVNALFAERSLCVAMRILSSRTLRRYGHLHNLLLLWRHNAKQVFGSVELRDEAMPPESAARSRSVLPLTARIGTHGLLFAVFVRELHLSISISVSGLGWNARQAASLPYTV